MVFDEANEGLVGLEAPSIKRRLHTRFEEQWQTMLNFRAALIVRESLPGKMYSTYGDPLKSPWSLQRRQLWSGDELASLDLLAPCAIDVLCAPATSIENERTHSVWRNVLPRLRQSVTPENAEYYVLARVWAKNSTHFVFGEAEGQDHMPTELDDISP